MSMAVLLGAGLAGCFWDDDAEQAKAAAQKFLDAWSSDNYDAAGSATDAPDGPRQWLPAVDEQLGATKVRFALGKGNVEGDDASQQFTASWTIPGQERRWSYPNKLTLVKKSDDWVVHWDPSVIHPDLRADLRFKTERTLPERAPILDRAGAPIFTKVPVVTVGLEPRKVPDINALAGKLATELKAVAADVTAAEIVADATKAKPDAFVPVVTLRAAAYQQVKPAIHALPGTIFRDSQKLLAPTPTFGQPMLGKVGDATAEVLKEAGPTFAAGDTLGLSGLQRAFNKQLAGAPAVKIALIDSAAKPVKQLAQFGGHPGEPLKTTLDRGVQTAAESALANVPQLASIVAIKPSTGEILAVANSKSTRFNIAMEGKYPPGSTFKIVTATALLEAGMLQPTSAVPCPGSLVAGGKKFINANQFNLGTVPFRKAFARSCNTTMISQAAKLEVGALAQTAARYGIGAEWKLPVTTYSGSVPPPSGEAERAADAIGQGKVLVSPFAMAMVAASVQRGSLPTPSLIAGQPAGLSEAPEPVKPTAIGPLRDFARAVVTEGTAKVLAGLPGGVAGKTGTAEYGDAKPPRSHSWFAGYRGDFAFAVFIHDGASTNLPATTVTNAFLKAAK
jgi:cell division protein FtsI/penicillin-binding protein 2